RPRVALPAKIVFPHPQVIDVSPTWLAWGNSQRSYQIPYLPAGNEDNPADEAKLLLPTPPAASQSNVKPRPLARKPMKVEQLPQHQLDAKADEGDENSKAGSPLGTVVDGPISGHEVHVAY